MAEPVRHRQTKGAATDMFDLPPPRHISTLRTPAADKPSAKGPKLPLSDHPWRGEHRRSRSGNGPPKGAAPAPKLTEGLHAWVPNAQWRTEMTGSADNRGIQRY